MIQENKELKEKLKTTTDKLKKAQAELENKVHDEQMKFPISSIYCLAKITLKNSF